MIRSDTAYEFLTSLPRYDKRGAVSLKPGFERIERLLVLMGNPQRAYPIVHVAGTNGKGSTASMVAAICTAAGMRVGLQTSPHLFDVTERMRIDGVPADSLWLSKAVHSLRTPIEQIGPSFFEATTALSFLYFAEQNVDLAVVEVGLGGRLDATNIVDPIVCAITSIGLDHTAILGSTLPAIATEKAGIIKDGIPVFTSNTNPDVVEVLRSVATTRNAPFFALADVFKGREVVDTATNTVRLSTQKQNYGTLRLDLTGKHQIENACLAIAIVESIAESIAHGNIENIAARIPGGYAGTLPDKNVDLVDAVRSGLANTRRLSGLRGRLDIIMTLPTVIADVAHNTEGIEAALRFARERCSGKLFVGIGLLRDKNYRSIADLIAREADVVQVVPLDGERALNPFVLEEALRTASATLETTETARDVLKSFVGRANPNDVLLLVGSHQVVAQLGADLMDGGVVE